MAPAGPRSKRPRTSPEQPASTTAPLAATSPESARAPLAIRFIHPPKLANRSRVLAGRLVIGRDPECDIVLDDETISRRHAELERAGSALAIRDLHSKNGLFCDGMRCELSPLELGRVVRLGDCVALICAQVPGDLGLTEVAPQLLGSHALAQVVEQAQRAARSNATVLLHGETGTGKELFARLIHDASGRSGPFVAVNCAALPETLIEAELFGHERGAFTGAERARPGLIREAASGTLFLDEVAELPLPTQAKLLRVLEGHEVLPLGRAQPIAVDLRVVCASHADLPALVAAGAFRGDLYARIEGVTLRLPPLRERRQDILELFLRLVERYRPGPRPSLSASFVEGLCAHDWPRNVRQLRQLAERLSVLLRTQSEWRRRDLLAALPELAAHSPSAAPPVKSSKPARALSRDELLAALQGAQGNVTVAAKRLAISKQTLYKHVAAHAIDLAEVRPAERPPLD